MVKKEEIWHCPICEKYFHHSTKQKHINMEIKELKKALKILSDISNK